MKNELIQYKAGFMDGKSDVLLNLETKNLSFLTIEEMDSWYKKGYKDGNNYYLNKLSTSQSQEEFVEMIYAENINDIIKECFKRFELNEEPTK